MFGAIDFDKNQHDTAPFVSTRPFRQRSVVFPIESTEIFSSKKISAVPNLHALDNLYRNFYRLFQTLQEQSLTHKMEMSIGIYVEISKN